MDILLKTAMTTLGVNVKLMRWSDALTYDEALLWIVWVGVVVTYK